MKRALFSVLMLITLSTTVIHAQNPASIIRAIYRNARKSTLHKSMNLVRRPTALNTIVETAFREGPNLRSSPLWKALENNRTFLLIPDTDIRYLYRKHGFDYSEVTSLNFRTVFNEMKQVNSNFPDFSKIVRELKGINSIKNDIKKSQEFLKQKGYYKDRVDADWGPNSQKAFDDYYTDHYQELAEFRHKVMVDADDLEKYVLQKAQIRTDLPVEAYTYQELLDHSISIRQQRNLRNNTNSLILRRRSEIEKYELRKQRDSEVLTSQGFLEPSNSIVSNREYQAAKKNFQDFYNIDEVIDYQLRKSGDQNILYFNESDDFLKYFDDIKRTESDCFLKSTLCITEKELSLKIECNGVSLTMKTRGIIELSATSKATQKSYSVTFPRKVRPDSGTEDCQIGGQLCLSGNSVSGSINICGTSIEGTLSDQFNLKASSQGLSVDFIK